MRSTQPEQGNLRKLPAPAQWLFLLVLSVIFALVLDYAHIPAATLIGPMLAAIVAGVNGATIRVPGKIYSFAHALIGCLVALVISVGSLAIMVDNWPIVSGVVIATFAASSLLGWLVSTWKVLPGTTAIWGSAPGAASAMILMAEAFGADSRLVAFMQYFRVLLVSLTAALVASLWVDTSGVIVPPTVWFPAIDPLAFATTGAAIAVGPVFGRLLRLPSPNLLGTMIVVAILHLAVGLDMQMPPWLLLFAYTCVGWNVGLNFTRAILGHAFRALPQIFLSTVTLMAVCGTVAWLLAHLLDVDPLTAYLATSPGGLDTIAIIAAATSSVDISFVMAIQLARLILAFALGPTISRMVARFVRD